ncbi:lycopene cyclase family protein [Streptomyces citrinus]|uniref:lycopene cyclase family protein n=1 Tax=Streptomyces citrinus TaxID=3118173 RepID=UPI003CC60D45
MAIIGAGAAGLSLADHLAPTPHGSPLTVTLIDAPPGPLRPPRRTWCFWESATGRYDEAVTASWRTLRVHGRDGRAVQDSLGPLRYKMIRSDDFEALIDRRLAHRPGFTRRDGTVEAVEGAADGARVLLREPGGALRTVSARWVFDSRPLDSLPRARTTLLQHFRGWFLRTPEPAFDTRAVELMDFRTPQPERGLAFCYMLPTSSRTALVEYTRFSASLLADEEYDQALRSYTRQVLGLRDIEIEATEDGVIPMTDARFARQVGDSVFRIGTAGGATRPSTGYTFSTIQRQARATAQALLAGRRPVPPRPHSRRSLAMDAVLLHGLDSGRIDGAAFFTRLFSRVPMERLLGFLDGDTTLLQDIGIGLRGPTGPLLRSAVALPAVPLRAAPGRRPRPLQENHADPA